MSQTDTIKVTDTIVQTAQFIWQRNGFCTSYLLEYYIVGLVTSNSIFKIKSSLISGHLMLIIIMDIKAGQ